MSSDELSYDSDDNFDENNEEFYNPSTQNVLKDENKNEDENGIKELNKDELFDLLIRKDNTFEKMITMDYSQLDEESRALVMEEIIENMIGYALKNSGYIVGWYPRNYEEHLRESRLCGRISEEKYNAVIDLIENCLNNADISFNDKIKKFSAFIGTDMDEKIIMAWNPVIGYRTKVINID